MDLITPYIDQLSLDKPKFVGPSEVVSDDDLILFFKCVFQLNCNMITIFNQKCLWRIKQFD